MALGYRAGIHCLIATFVRLRRKSRMDMPEAVSPVGNPPFPMAQSAGQAALRGARNRCPRCDHKPLFARYLKPVQHCAGCGQDWTLHQADDFPTYIAILLSGHILAPLLIAVGSRELLPMWMLMIGLVLIALVLTTALLQPAKGVVIALQHWWGMHGFERGAVLAKDAQR